MKTLICPTCGCSLVRLGISKNKSVAQHHDGEEYRFCCQGCIDVFITDHLVTKDMLTVRVGIKETEDPIPLCYCFGYDRKAVRDDIHRNGETDILKIITQRVRAGECRCEETNPSGGCCLGQVQRAIKQAQALHQQGFSKKHDQI